jgi:hypothetical protein
MSAADDDGASGAPQKKKKKVAAARIAVKFGNRVNALFGQGSNPPLGIVFTGLPTEENTAAEDNNDDDDDDDDDADDEIEEADTKLVPTSCRKFLFKRMFMFAPVGASAIFLYDDCLFAQH